MDYAKIFKGDVEGHSFHGNQYSGGSAGKIHADAKGSAVAKVLGWPSSNDPRCHMGEGGGYWRKRGGYDGEKTVDRVMAQAEKQGFVKETRLTGNADGSVMGETGDLIHPSGWRLSGSKSYGSTKDSNSYSLTLSLDKKSS